MRSQQPQRLYITQSLFKIGSRELLSLYARQLAFMPVALLAAPQIPIATPAIPVARLEALVPHSLAPPLLAVAIAPVTPIVIAADTASPVALLPFHPRHPRLCLCVCLCVCCDSWDSWDRVAVTAGTAGELLGSWREAHGATWGERRAMA